MKDNQKMIFLKLLRQNSRKIKKEVFSLMNNEMFNNSQINLILHLNSDQGRPLNIISKIVQVQKSNLTTLVNSLESIDVVKRERSSIDRRVIFLKLTDKGKHIKAQLSAEYEKNLSIILKDMTKEEISEAIRILEIIKDKIWG